MTHKRKELRHLFIDLLRNEFEEIPIESNRAHSVSSFPLLNVMNGQDNGEIEDYTNTSEPRRMDLEIEINVASNSHDDDIDDILYRIENVVRKNRKSAFWSRCFFNLAESPETVPGKTSYSVSSVYITFMYEVSANVTI